MALKGLSGAVVLAASVAVTAGAAETWPMPTTNFDIPINVPDHKRPGLRELVLWYTKDEGRTWEPIGKVLPDQTKIPVRTPGAGKFGFVIAEVDKDGKQTPRNVGDAPVSQWVVVDLEKPDAAVEARRAGDEIHVSWRITEEHPEPDSLKVEYKLADAPAVKSLPGLKPGPTGTVSFRPESAASVSVKLEIHDKAGNIGTAVAEVPAAIQTTGYTPPAKAEKKADPVKPPPPPPDVTPPPPPPPPPSLDLGPKPALTEVKPGALPVTQPVDPRGPSAGASAAPGKVTRPGLPEVQVVNQRQVKLDFLVDKSGPSGLGGVEVYVTADDGLNWDRARFDPKTLVLPESRGGAPVQASVLVPIPSEGVVYGLYVVVKSKAGQGKPAPQRGEPPQLRVELDTLPPTAEILPPQPDPVRRDCLVLAWNAQDKNLADNPITLEWSAPGGTWAKIAEDLPNTTGRYTWEVPPHAPPSVFLKLTIKDTAGNVGAYQTAQPILIDLSVPEVKNVKLGQAR